MKYRADCILVYHLSQSHYGHFASLEELCKGLFHAIFMTSRHLPFKTVICMWFTRYIMDREMQIDPKGNCPPVFGQAEVVLKLQRGWLNCRCWVRVVKMSLWFRMSPKWWIPASSVWSLKKKVRIEYFLYTHTYLMLRNSWITYQGKWKSVRGQLYKNKCV